MEQSTLGLVVIGVLAVAFIVAAVSMLVFPIQPKFELNAAPQNAAPNVNVLLYAGEISGGKFGFGFSPDNLTSPGPTLRFKTSDVVNLTVINAGNMPHAFAVVNAPHTGAVVEFNAQIASATSPLLPGKSGSVIFAPNSPSALFYYICPIAGHAESGMYGSVVVTVG